MIKKISELEDIYCEIDRIKGLLGLLTNHFETTRYPNDQTLDWYSLKYQFEEYTILIYMIQEQLNDSLENMNEYIKNLYDEFRGNNRETDNLKEKEGC